jgi:hypothetical protein
MMAVIEMDRMEWEAKKKAEAEPQTTEGQEVIPVQEKPVAPATANPQPGSHGEYDSDSYEEVEVTDDEGEEVDTGAAKRPRISQEEGTPPPATGPVEFAEDDIAWQLAEMEGNYDEDQYAGSEGPVEAENEDQGLELTASDNAALFRSLLDDSGISPYSTFEKVIEDSLLVEDPRYVALPNMASRKEAFASWSKDRIMELQARKEAEMAAKRKRDPKVEYLRFLHKHATPKLYWPEFKRKFKKEPEMKDLTLQDKDREKLYREYISKLKLSDSDRRKELVTLLKSVKAGELSRDTKLEELPDNVLKDVKFYLVEERRRDELVRTFLETL